MFETFQLIAAAGDAAQDAGVIEGLANTFKLKPEVLLAQAINFLVVAGLLWFLAFRPVTRTIDDRQKKIADGLQYAEEMKEQLAEAEKKHGEKLREASEEAQRILHKAKENAQKMEERAQSEAQERADEIVRKAREATGHEREQMMQEVRKEVAGLVIATTEKVLAKQLSEEERSSYSETAAKELAGT